MPLNYRTVRTVYGPTENKLKKRNNTVREVFNAKGIPRNMGNKEILRRVKVYNNLMTTKPERGLELGSREGVRKISDFVTNGRVFNRRKRKALAELMLRFDDAWGGQGRVLGFRGVEILALKNEDVIRYIKYMADFFGVVGFPNYAWAPHYIANLIYKGRRGPIREDPGAVRVLKKRTAFIKELLKVQLNPTTNGGVYISDLPRNVRNKISLTYHYSYMGERDIWRYMQKEFPLPPHPKNAATKIQAAVRGMINRTTVKKMKTVAGKRKASTSIKTTSPKRTKTKR